MTNLVVIDSFDGLPPGGAEPMSIELMRQLSSSDGSEYWLGRLNAPVEYQKDGHRIRVQYAIVAPGWVGGSFFGSFEGGRIILAYVCDETILQDSAIDLAKCDYVAFGSGRKITLQKASTGTFAFLALFWAWINRIRGHQHD